MDTSCKTAKQQHPQAASIALHFAGIQEMYFREPTLGSLQESEKKQIPRSVQKANGPRNDIGWSHRIERGVGSKAWICTPNLRISSKSNEISSPMPMEYTMLSCEIPDGHTRQHAWLLPRRIPFLLICALCEISRPCRTRITRLMCT